MSQGMFSKLRRYLRDLYVEAAALAVRIAMRAVKKSIRFEKIGFEDIKGPVILALWHESYFVAGYANPFDKVAVLTTKGIMGDIASKAIGHFGPRIIRASFGSDAKQGAYAVLQLIKASEDGFGLVIVPDGPKGPRRRSKKGIFYLSEKTGKKIVPVGVAASRKITMHFRWDKYFIPLPFSRVVILADRPYDGPPDTEAFDAALENARKKAEQIVMR